MEKRTFGMVTESYRDRSLFEVDSRVPDPLSVDRPYSTLKCRFSV